MSFIFAACAAISIATAIGVVASRNPVYSALFLVGNLLTVAAMFAALNAHFLAVAQIIVYAGAIMVLFLFVIMLLNVKIEEPAPIALVGVGLLGSIALAAALLKSVGALTHTPPLATPEEIAANANGTVKALGFELFTNYVFPFEVASVLIIAAIVGAVMLSQKVSGRARQPTAALNAAADSSAEGKGKQS